MNDAGSSLTPVDHDPFAGPALAAFAPVTESQREVWLACEVTPEVSVGYNEGLDLRLYGPLDAEALRQSLERLIARHEALRMTFSPDGEWLCVRESMPLPLNVERIDSGQALAAVAQQEMATPFDLSEGPLVRFRLLQLAAEQHHLLFVAHHAICDGWSGAVILTELAQLYSAAIENRTASLEPAPLYTEYAALELDWRASAEGASHRRYWLDELTPLPPPLDLPSDHPRGTERSYRADRVDAPLPPEFVARLRKLGADHGASLVATLLAGFSVLLHRLTATEDVLVGLAAAGQSLHQMPGLVGHCVNLLPLRLRPARAQSFGDLLKRTRATVLDAFDHQGATLGSLLPQLAPERDSARPVLVSVVFNVDVRDDDLSHSGLDVSYETMVRQAENFELYLNIVDNGRNLVIEASYNAGLFARDTIERWIAQYQRLLDAVCRDPTQTVDRLVAPDDAERGQLLATASGGTAPIPDGCIHERIAAQAQARPDAQAVIAGGRSYTYRQVVERAAVIAAALQAQDVQPGDFVGVCLQRHVDLPAALIGVMMAGAAYVPLDPDLPAARLQFMLSDASAKVLLCEAATADAVGDVALPRLDIESIAAAGSPRVVAPSPRSAAYAIYTSGSTGTPKGVVAHHRGVLNCFAGTQALVPMRETDTLLAIATFAFDASVLELFMPLVYGARLALVTREEAADGTTLARAIEHYQATRIFTAPAAWRLLVSAGWSGKSDLVGISWAEPLTRDLAAALLPRLEQLWNLYGPTETTVWMLGRRISDATAPITIGRPIPNTRAYVLDAAGRPVGRGVTGELYIGGAGVALGYLNRPELDAERFLPDPFANGDEDGRMYRTGDLARWTAEGEIECLGRADFQVKLRGYRIELGEIEAVLNAHAQVAEAACGVLERSAGDPRLVAWVEAKAGAELGSSELRRHVRQSLPGYMVPQHFVTIARLPRLPNGKLDRRALPDPFGSESAAPVSKTPPRSDAERAIYRIWSEVLGHTDIGVEDRFLDVGGHSMLAVQVAAQIQQQFGVKPPLRIVMMESLAQLAAACQIQPQHEPDPEREPAEAQNLAAVETVQDECSTAASRASGDKSVSWWKKWLKP